MQVQQCKVEYASEPEVTLAPNPIRPTGTRTVSTVTQHVRPLTVTTASPILRDDNGAPSSFMHYCNLYWSVMSQFA